MKKIILNTICLGLAVLFSSSIGASSVSAQGNRSAEVEQYINMLNSSSRHQRITTAKKISRSGLSEEKLFDMINDILLKNYKKNTRNSQQIDEMSWLCKALASSGLDKYGVSLKSVADNTQNPKLKKYALQSLNLIKQFAERNRVMTDDKHLKEGFSPELARYINMLRSEDLTLKRDAAKHIFRSVIMDERLYDIVEEELLKEFVKTPKEREYDEYGEEVTYGASRKQKLQNDTSAWLCKALGASGMGKYIETLEKIAKTSSDMYVRRHAKDSLNMLK